MAWASRKPVARTEVAVCDIDGFLWLLGWALPRGCSAGGAPRLRRRVCFCSVVPFSYFGIAILTKLRVLGRKRGAPGIPAVFRSFAVVPIHVRSRRGPGCLAGQPGVPSETGRTVFVRRPCHRAIPGCRGTLGYLFARRDHLRVTGCLAWFHLPFSNPRL